MADDALPQPQDTNKLESGEDLALKALSEASESDSDSEVAASDELADSLNHLQNVIERNALELQRLKEEMKQKRESLKSVFENDAQLAEAEEEQKKLSGTVKERRAQISSSPQATSLKAQIGELKEQQKDIEETLSNHLINYYSITNSKSFDTSEGDQWEFNITAKVKTRRS